jgi:hypothetical protein
VSAAQGSAEIWRYHLDVGAWDEVMKPEPGTAVPTEALSGAYDAARASLYVLDRTTTYSLGKFVPTVRLLRYDTQAGSGEEVMTLPGLVPHIQHELSSQHADGFDDAAVSAFRAGDAPSSVLVLYGGEGGLNGNSFSQKFDQMTSASCPRRIRETGSVKHWQRAISTVTASMIWLLARRA